MTDTSYDEWVSVSIRLHWVVRWEGTDDAVMVRFCDDVGAGRLSKIADDRSTGVLRKKQSQPHWRYSPPSKVNKNTLTYQH